MKKIFGTNLGTFLVYSVISLIIIGLSSLPMLMNDPYNYYPVVVTAISFVFGALYLLASLVSINKKVKMSDNKSMNVISMMGGNFLRFSILIVSIVCVSLFLYFGPKVGETPKWVYLLLLITGAPMFLNIGLFYLRGKYVE